MASRKTLRSGKRAASRRPRRVVVAMSGGVDSSVVAALLKQQGHEVIGVTLQLYDHGEAVGRRGACCAGQDIHDARRVADRLGIAHYVLDYEQRFKATVMQSFADSYVAGETPIPCVVCNQQIKFHELLATARELEADTLATGHYIELRAGPAGPELCRARDAERDQSYFLFATTRAQLDWLMFPLGRLSQGRGSRAGAAVRAARRRQVRQPGHLLRAAGPLHQHHRAPEARRGAKPATSCTSTAACSAATAASSTTPSASVAGLGIPGPAPLYVVRLDAAAKQVVVGPRESLHAHWITLRNVNWLGDEPIPSGGMSVAVRVRSTSPPQPATLFPSGDGARVLLRDGEYGVAAGQACVFYADAGPRGAGAGRRMDRARVEPGRAAGDGGRGGRRDRRNYRARTRVSGGHLARETIKS